MSKIRQQAMTPQELPPIPPTKRGRGRPPRPKNKRPPEVGSKPQSHPLEPFAVRVAEAAALIGCGTSKMKELIANGTVESVKLGSMRLVKVSSLKRLLGE
jgi:excisionase family DNA binding protein